MKLISDEILIDSGQQDPTYDAVYPMFDGFNFGDPASWTQGQPFDHFRQMREQAPMVMFPDKDGTPWSPPSQSSDNVANEQATATGFLPLNHPGRALSRYEVPENLWKHWGTALNT